MQVLIQVLYAIENNGYLAVTDANLILGRLLPDHFPKIFGESEDQPLDKEASKVAFENLTREINEYNKIWGSDELNIYEVAYGFIKVANEAMNRPIRAITQARGFNPKNHILSIFGGAGGQHGWAIARALGISQVFIHRYCGILSAYGMGMANVIEENEIPYSCTYTEDNVMYITENHFGDLAAANIEKLKSLGFQTDKIEHKYFLNLRYEGTDTPMMVNSNQETGSFLEVFK